MNNEKKSTEHKQNICTFVNFYKKMCCYKCNYKSKHTR